MRTIIHPWQRALLHAVCLCRRPRNSRFHLQGIAREFDFPSISLHGVSRADAFLLVLSAVTAIATQSLVHQYKNNPEPWPREVLTRQVAPPSGMSPAVHELAKLGDSSQDFRKQ